MAEQKTDPKPGTPEYDQKMREVVDKANTPPDKPNELPVTPMPEGGHAKFYDAKTGAYNWQGHAQELQYQLTQKAGKKDDPPPKEEPPADGDVDAGDIITRAGLKVEDLNQQLANTGKLDNAAKAALVKVGVPESMIDEYVGLISFRLAETKRQALEYAGGQEAWTQLDTWATQNLPPEDKDKINRMLASPDWKDAIDLLKTKRSKADPLRNEGKLNTGGTGTPKVEAYASREQMKVDMRDPRYKTDGNFRAMVAAKLRVSNFDNEPRA